MWNLKYGKNKHIYKPETDSHMQRIDLWLPRGRVAWEGRTGSVGLAHVNYFFVGWVISKYILLDSTGNYIQYPVINHKGKRISICI